MATTDVNMTSIGSLSDINDRAAARFADTTTVVPHGSEPSLHLYHAPNSICSQKVRAVLAFKQLPYISHLLDIFRGETYDPAYVTLRMAGGVEAGLTMVSDHRGTTSVQLAGFDGCVVPTLYDARTAKVLVDSRYICVELAGRGGPGAATLIPDALSTQIGEELDLVDNLPNYQLLAVTLGKPSKDAPANQFALGKVRRCEALLMEHGGDPLLCEAYSAKRAKEQAAADKLFHDGAMLVARNGIAQAVCALETRLSRSHGAFLYGDQVTMADLFWGLELARIEDLGLANLWSGGALPGVDDYHRTLDAVPAISHALDDWVGARFSA